MHPEIQERLTREAEELIPLAEQKCPVSLKSWITMNGAGVAGVPALLQAFPEGRGLFVLGLTAVFMASVEVFTRSVLSCPPAEERAGQLISN